MYNVKTDVSQMMMFDKVLVEAWIFSWLVPLCVDLLLLEECAIFGFFICKIIYAGI